MVHAKRRGMALTELMIASAVGVLALSAMVGTSIATSRVAAKLTNGSGTIRKVNSGFGQIVNDIKGADRCLAKYPPTGTAQFESNDHNTLILRVPENNNFETYSDKFTVVIYYLSACGGEDGPAMLMRYTASVVGGATPNATLDSVVATQVNDFSLAYVGHQTFWPDWNMKNFSLATPSIGDLDGCPEQALIDGTDYVHDGRAAFANGKLTFAAQPPPGKLIDATYNVDPSTIITDFASNGAWEVYVHISSKPTWRDQSGAERSREVEFASRVAMRNRL